MKLFEYEAKEIVREYDLPVPNGYVASTPDEAKVAWSKIGRPSMIKAQVLVAGRGKAGGIKPASSADEAFQVTKYILSTTIKGEKAVKVLVEEKIR